MTYRDPLYDANSPATEGTLEDQFDEFANESSGTEGSGESGGSVTQKGQEVADAAREKGEQVVGQAQEKGQQAAETARGKAYDALDNASAKADELGQVAQERADQGIDKASEGLSAAADMLRQQGEKQPGQVGTIATTAADKLESASGYLRERDTNQMVNDLEELVRRRPMESLLAAAGIGLLLSRIVK